MCLSPRRLVALVILLANGSVSQKALLLNPIDVDVQALEVHGFLKPQIHFAVDNVSWVVGLSISFDEYHQICIFISLLNATF